MYQGDSRNRRTHQEDKELARAIFLFTIVALFIGILLVKGAL